MKVVLDTNVLVSGILWHGTCRKILRLVSHNRIQAITSEELTAELLGILSRRFKFTPTEDEFARGVLTDLELVWPTQTLDLCRDPQDNRVLEAALAGNCQYIITGDEDLLVLKEVQGVEIVNPADFLVLYQ